MEMLSQRHGLESQRQGLEARLEAYLAARPGLAVVVRSNAPPSRARSYQVVQYPDNFALMHRCLAPCVDLCTPESYAEVMQESMLFLEGFCN